ncbi:MAG: amidohydrolase family protein, partial [Thermovirgaceae bacterium]|nr:amidohydrolase family protein [Thermovirgaceae bacterium]
MTKGRIVSVGGVIDGTGGSIQRGVVLEIKGDRIAEIRRVEADADPREKVVEDLSGYTLLPAFADVHVHLCMSGSVDGRFRRRQLRQPYEEAQPIIARHLREHLSCGVLAVRDGGDYGGYAHRFRREILSRRNLPVVLRAAGRAWHAPGHYGALVGRVPLKERSLAQSIRETRRETDLVKIINSGINSLTDFGKETPPQFRPGELKEAIREGERLGLKTMVHANGCDAVKEAAEAGCHSVEHGFFMGRDNLKRLRDRGIVWVPTAFTMEAYARTFPPGSLEADTARRTLDHQLNQIRLAG